MGLCKCPKRKVTNLFCFEHRVNVCEHCLVANHTKCIVKSYLQWLQDSDYNAQCTLCNRNLSDEECGDCVRLTCYDVFHWACLNHYAQRMPAQTAPAGYQCPTCSAGIFPQSNLVSPIADALKELLKQVNWARAGLGLPLIEEVPQQTPPEAVTQSSNSVAPQEPNAMRSEASLGYAPGLGATPNPHSQPAVPNAHNSTTVGTMNSRPSAQVAPYSATPTPHPVSASNHHSVISVDEGTTSRNQERSGFLSNPRKLFDTTKEDEVFVKSKDHDEDKYKRRPALQWLGQWFNVTDSKNRRDPNAVRKRFFIVLLIGLIGFITIIIIFSKLGRQATEDDPAFDPMANPNIKVGKEEIMQP